MRLHGLDAYAELSGDVVVAELFVSAHQEHFFALFGHMVDGVDDRSFELRRLDIVVGVGIFALDSLQLFLVAEFFVVAYVVD